MNNASEVARLRQQIAQEVTAMQHAKSGFASVARHEIITHHYTALGDIFERLSAQVGETTAIVTIMNELEKQI